MPVLKIDPTSGESLNKAKTKEQVAEEEAARLKALADYKERVKEKKPRKKKAVEEPEIEATKETGIIVKAAVPIPVKVNPFLAPNGEINADELIEPLNTILEEIEHNLQLMTKGYKLSANTTDAISALDLPKEFKYIPSVTRITDGSDAFNLVKPNGITKLEYDKLNKDIYVDRVFFKPLDIKELLKYPEKARELLKKVIIDGMWKNLWETKKLDSKNKYFGTKVASIKGVTTICHVNTNYDEAMIEVRMFSDITPLPEGK